MNETPKKLRLPFSLIPFFILFLFFAAVQIAGAESDLEQNYLEQDLLKQHTLESPLVSGTLAPALITNGTQSILTLPSEMRFQGDFLFEKLDPEGFRLSFVEPQELSSISWLFEKHLDLRNRWFRLRYSDLQTPKQIDIEFDQSDVKEPNPFPLLLGQATREEDIYFKIPEEARYGDINAMRMTFDLNGMKNEDLDFLILGLDLLPADTDPLRPAEK